MDSIAIFGDRDCMYPSTELAITPARFRERVAAQFLSPENLEYLRLLFAQQVPPGPLRDFTLRTLRDSAQEFGGGSSAGDSRILDEVATDPLAQRGENAATLDLWSEVRRINRIFFDDRMALLREQAAIISEGPGTRAPLTKNTHGVVHDGLADDNESYHMRMFISDSLRPPGLERLNTPGPNWAIQEDQSSWLPKDQRGVLAKASADCRISKGAVVRQARAPPRPPLSFLPPQGLAAASMLYPKTPEIIARELASANTHASSRGQRERFAAAPAAQLQRPSDRATGRTDSYGKKSYNFAGIDPLEAPRPNPRLWGPNGAGRTNMDPEAAVAEYWSDDWPSGATTIGSTEIANAEYGAVESWGDRWQENGGTRFMRYESIPFWQKGGRSGYEYDIEETLGTAGRELDSDVRRWDMERVRTDVSARAAATMAGPPPWNRAGGYAPIKPVQWGRRYGPRSGGNV